MEHINEFLKNVRVDYNLDPVDEINSHNDPVNQFAAWMKLAVDANIAEPNAMNLSTVSAQGMPSCRIVLLRNFDQDGFVFFTNYNSHKGRELDTTQKASLNFFWPELFKQIRIEGMAERVDNSDSDEYFSTRPRESQISAWVSIQSQHLSDRLELEKKVANLTKEYEGKAIARPPFWGGYRIRPSGFEFWQGRPNRLHDRIRYDRTQDNQWKKYWLYP